MRASRRLRRPGPVTGVLLAACIGSSALVALQEPDRALADALRTALAPALPFPEARPDGTAPDSSSTPVWTIRWPADGESRIEVLANPLNSGNRERALKAEEEIQKSAMQSQRRSQSDYDRALDDFQRTGRVGEIREVSLRDDGLAGERYDAESQLTITAEFVDARYAQRVGTSALPVLLPGSNGPAAVVRLASNTYREAQGDEPVSTRYAPEQAWVFFGPIAPPAIARDQDNLASLSTERSATAVSRALVVHVSGNAELVDRVLRNADWSRLVPLVGG
jgi:hypothetical protein